MLSSTVRRRVEAVTLPVARRLARAGVTAPLLTALGLAGALGASALIATGRLGLGGTVLVVAGLADLLDGPVARASGTAGPWGAFVDAVADRVSDAALLGAIAWRFRLVEPRVAALAVSGLVLAFLVSYVKARAEGLGFRCEGGLAERAERLIVLLAGILLGIMEAALWAFAVLAAVTVAQRAAIVWRQASAGRP